MELNELVSMSNRYGKNPAYVLAGGGNTSCKQGDTMYVKCSGTKLATITEEGFVPVSRDALKATMEKQYPDSDKERESAFLQDVQASRILEGETRRPSVEALLHALFPQRYVLHLHPACINGLTCAVNGEAEAKRLFGETAIWIGICRPGYILGKLCWEAMGKYRASTGRDANLILLQNHGVFLAANTVEEIDTLFEHVYQTVCAQKLDTPDLTPAISKNPELGATLAAAAGYPVSVHCTEAEFLKLSASRDAAYPLSRPFTPDHIVACGAYPAWVETTENLSDLPGHRFAFVRNHGIFCFGNDIHAAQTVRALVLDAAAIAAASKRFGGPLHMTEDMTDFITHWEAESYRAKKF